MLPEICGSKRKERGETRMWKLVWCSRDSRREMHLALVQPFFFSPHVLEGTGAEIGMEIMRRHNWMKFKELYLPAREIELACGFVPLSTPHLRLYVKIQFGTV